MRRSGFRRKPTKPAKVRNAAAIAKTKNAATGRAYDRTPADLEAARYELVARSGGFCEVDTPGCSPGRHRGHHAHHALMRSQGGGGHDAAVMLWVCWEAHAHIHANPKESYERGWLIHPNRTNEPGIGGSYMKQSTYDALADDWPGGFGANGALDGEA